METLDFFGIATAFTIGICIGAAIMYFGGILIDWSIERRSKS